MKEKILPWWLVSATGLVILAAGIYLLVSPQTSLSALTFLLAVGVLGFSIFNFAKAYSYRSDNRYFVPFLVHAMLDAVLFLLLVIIKSSPALLGVILSSWFIIFGLFGLIHARQDENKSKARVSALLLLIGIALILLPFLLSIDHVLFLGIVSILIGVFRTAQGIVYKVKLDGRTSGGRANLL